LTTSQPDDAAYTVTMRPQERHSTIIARLAEKGMVDVSELEEIIGVSGATIRRDLVLLEEQHVLTRTHGGAVTTNFAYELPLKYKESRQRTEKDLIALEAATLVSENMHIGLSGGTTLTRIARAFAPGCALTVVTNSLSIASELAQWPQHTLIVTGGLVRARSYEMVGPIAEHTIQEFGLDLCIIGADGVSAAGVTTYDHAEAVTNRALVEIADMCVVAVDHTKLDERTFATICGLDSVDLLLTTAQPPPNLADSLASNAVKVQVAYGGTADQAE